MPKPSLHFLSKVGSITVVAALLVNASWAANQVTALYSFTGGSDGGDPHTWLTFDSQGNLYGTTVTGGKFGFGTVFELSPSSGTQWTETVLYSFAGAPDGKNPYGGVTLDGAGHLYGTTAAGGSGGTCTGDGCGTVFELSPSGNTWTETVIYNFTGGNDGGGPGNGVVFGNGSLFGMTPDGGLHSAGVVYELSPMPDGQWKQTVVHAFTGGDDGGVGSLGPLFYGGNFYGVTEIGGANNAGTVFQLDQTPPGGWKLVTLYAFKGEPDAGFPYGGVTTDAERNLYGTTYFGGANGAGAVFKLSGTGKERVLYSFKGGSDGSASTSALYFDQQQGKLYGTTSTGGTAGCDCGTVFDLGRSGEAVLHRFTNTPDGAYVYYGLTADASGNLYGSTTAGGTHGQGMVFSLTP